VSDFDFDFDDLDLDDVMVAETVTELEKAGDIPVPPDGIDVNNVDPSQFQPHFGGTDDMVSKTSPTITASSDDLIIGANGEGSRSPSEHYAGRDEFKPSNR
jgi:hypothetical protein